MINLTYLLFALIFTSSTLYAELVEPGNGSTLYHRHVFFRWEQIPDAIEYDFQITKDPLFQSDVIQISVSDIGLLDRENIEWESTYHWRVRPVFESHSGLWTQISTFITGPSLSSATVEILQDCCQSDGITVFGAFFNYFSAAIDKNGLEIWNSGPENFVYYSTDDYGNLFGCNLMGGSENNLPGLERTFQGEILWEEPNNEFLHHDLIRLPNGNYLGIVESNSMGPIPIGPWSQSFQGLGFQADGTSIEFPWVGDKLVEWDRETKQVVWSWNTFDHFNMSDFDNIGGTWNEAYFSMHYDWTHINAIIFDEEDSSIYMSVRHLSRITKIDYPSGNIIWNLGHQMPSGDVELGNELGFSFQHSLQKLENGNLLTFDNGNLSTTFRGTDEPVSRAIEISIENDGVIEWAYELEQDLFGFASGNAQKLANGNVLITTVGGGGRSLEVDEDGQIIWQGLYNLSLPDGAVYRAHRIPGIYSAAYTVRTNDLSDNSGEIGLYTPIGYSTIEFTVANKGDYPIHFTFQVTDLNGFFNASLDDVIIGSQMSQNIVFEGIVEETSSSIIINLGVTPIHHPHLERALSIIAFSNQLRTRPSSVLTDFHLHDAFPNPFNSSTTLSFDVERETFIHLKAFNIQGRLIKNIISEKYYPGNHSLIWNLDSDAGGIYFIQYQSENHTETQKVLLLK